MEGSVDETAEFVVQLQQGCQSQPWSLLGVLLCVAFKCRLKRGLDLIEVSDVSTIEQLSRYYITTGKEHYEARYGMQLITQAKMLLKVRYSKQRIIEVFRA